MSKNDDEVLVRVEGVSKKFCRSLKKSLWYGVCDIAGELLPGRKRLETRDEGRELSDRSAQDISRSLLDTGLSTAAASALDSGPSTLDSSSGLRAGEFFAVKDVSFELRRGECLGLIGHNGAGKTTLLKMLNGLIKPDAGSITMRGRVGALIALGAGFNPILTGRENIYINGSVLGLTKKEIDAKIDEIIDFAEIREFIDMPVQSYSSGMTVRLGFAVASSLNPDVLILDEVLAVGDVSFQAKCLNRLADLRQKGVPFILVGHNMQQISRYCQKVIILKKGIIKFCGNAEEGIALYLNDMHDIKAISKNNALKWGMPNGSGKLVFTGSQFYNLDRQIVSKVKSEEGIIFSISYEKKDVDLKIPIFDVSIYANGEQIFQSTSKGKIKLQNLSTRGCFELQLSSIPVNCKLIEFRCCAMDEETNELFDWKRGIFISVERDSKQLGILKLQHCWNAN